MGGGTSSYQEIEETDLIILWGSNARETHPIFFHHLLKGIRNGAKLYVVDPRRTSSARWADEWLGLDVGTDVQLANAVAREMIASGLENRTFIEQSTSRFDEFKAGVEKFTLEYAERETGVPAEAIRSLAHAYARADRAQLCWTLGITEHQNAVDNVLALLNLSLLTGHVGRYGSGVNPLRGQNNVQGGGDMGALPDRLPGFQHVENEALRSKFEQAWGVQIPLKRGLHISGMLSAMDRGDIAGLYIIGENPLHSEADQLRTAKLLGKLDFLLVQDISLTATGELADVVLPAAAGWCETEGTVTSSERKVQRVRKAMEPPPGARDDVEILCELSRRLGHDFGNPGAEEIWDELRRLSPIHAGMSYARLESLGGLRWPCYDEDHPGELYLHGRLWSWPLDGPAAPFHLVEAKAPADRLDEHYPIRLTTGRRLESFNTGVQSSLYRSPLRRSEAIALCPQDGERLGVAEGDRVRVVSRRASVLAPVRYDQSLRPGLAFMTPHSPNEVATNTLTADATDPRSGTAEFKAVAIRIEKTQSMSEEQAGGTGE